MGKKINFSLFLLTLVALVLALVLRVGLGYSGYNYVWESPAWICVAIVAGLIVTNMVVGMIMTLRSGRVGIDILAVTAIVTTLFINDHFGNSVIEGYWATIMIMVMITGGESLEDYASGKAERELKSLLNNAPTMAHLLVDGTAKDVSADSVNPGDPLLVKPGESVPVDGTITKGSSTFDESSLTGESKPVDLGVGEKVLSGSINGDFAIEIKADKKASESQYQTIVSLVKSAASHPAKFVRIADKYAVPFTLVSYFIAGMAWLFSWVYNRDETFIDGLTRAAQVLVVASPCPLILAAPIALISGMSRSSRNGIIVKNSDSLERLSRARTVAFDKTGTITRGVLNVGQVFPEKGFSADQLLTYTGSAEQNSSHILARSLLGYLKERKLYPVEHAKEIPGNGLEASVNGKNVRIGKRAFILPEAEKDPSQNLTATYVEIDGKYAGYITFKDVVRPETKKTLAGLKASGIKDLMLLTGDNEKIAQRVAKEVGITTIKANCLPQDKIDIIKNAPKGARPIVMVGDGVNDAPALAAADVGIAMGAKGSTAATESADMVILLDDLSRVGKAFTISKDTLRIANIAVLVGISLSLVLEIIAATGVIPALVGAILQECVDVISIFTALGALYPKEKKTAILANRKAA